MWGKILSRDNFNRSHRVIELIEKQLLRDYKITSEIKEYSLFNGNLGIALFFLYLNQVKPNNELEDSAYSIIESALNNFTTKNELSILQGAAGILYFLNHIEKHFGIEIPFDRSAILETVFNSGMLNIKSGYFDYLKGGTGKIYATINSDTFYNLSVLDQILNDIEDISEPGSDNNITWRNRFTYDLKENLEKEYNIGLSHGMLSLLQIICKIQKVQNNSSGKGHLLIKSACNWMLSQKIIGFRSIYPYAGEMDYTEENSSRLGWCYGDLGVAFTLNNCAKQNSLPYLYKEADLAVINSLNRLTIESSGINNPWFCHGASGVMHLLTRYFSDNEREALKHSENEFKECVNYWNKKSTDFFLENKTFKLNDRSWESGILEGTAGVGLALISQVYGLMPNWDDIFTMD